MLRTYLFVCSLLIILLEVSGDAFLELKLEIYDNAASKGWDGSSCDPAYTACDHRFLISIDKADGRKDGLAGSKVGSIFHKQSGYFQNQNKNVFSADISGIANPIVQNFVKWPGTVLFKMYVQDDDSFPLGGDDDIDAFIHPLDLRPQGSQSTAQWTQLVMRGLRNSNPSSLQLEYRLYCGQNFYGKDCAVECVAQDSSQNGHYTCDPNTGDFICLPGWKEPGNRCLTKINYCENNDCKNGATCISQNVNYTCNCRVGFSGNKCEMPLNIQCKDGFVGDACDIDVCDFLHCKNGGTCRAGACECRAGFTGDYCEQGKSCKDRPCQNDGTCHDVGYICDCLPDYTGTRCQTRKPNTTVDAETHTSNATVEAPIHDRITECEAPTLNSIFTNKEARGLFIALIIIAGVLLLIVLLLIILICRLRRRVRNAEKDCKMLANGASSSVSHSTERSVSHNTYQSNKYISQSSVFSDVSTGSRSTSVSELMPVHYAELDNPIVQQDPHYDTLKQDLDEVEIEKKRAQREKVPLPRPKVEHMRDVTGKSMAVDRKSSC